MFSPLLYMINILFMMSSNSLIMTFILITMVLTMLLMYSLMALSWTQYVLLLVYIGGMLVIFTYITSSSSNNMFIINSKFMILLFVMMFEMSYFSGMLIMEDSMMFSKMSFSYLNPMVLLLFIFVVLYVSVMMISMKKYPMRSF